MARADVNEDSFYANLLWDIERMRSDKHTDEEILNSVVVRLAKRLKYEALYVREMNRNRAYAAMKRSGVPRLD